MQRTRHQAAPALIGARSAWRIAAVLLAGAAFILWLGRCTDIDLMLADDFYDAGLHDFPWRHAWLTETFSHGILKMMLTLGAIGCILLALHDVARPQPGRSPLQRLRLRVMGLSALLVPLVTSSLKQASVAHCPWDLARYGGSEPYLRLFDALPFGVQGGIAYLPGMHRVRCGWCHFACCGCPSGRAPRCVPSWLRSLLAAPSVGCSSCVARTS